MLTPESKVIIYKGKRLKDGSHPIVLQVKVAARDYRRIGLKMSAFLHDWNATDSRFRDTVKYEPENRDLFDHETKANEIINKMIQEMKKKRIAFDFNRFKADFLGIKYETSDKPDTLLGFLDWYSEHLRHKNRLGDRTCYTTLRSVLPQHGVDEKMKMDDVNTDWLEDLETKLIKRKNHYTGEPIKMVSVFSYFKRLKSLFNKAIYFGVTENYPFRNSANPRGYSFAHLTSPRISKSMSDEEVELFMNFDWQGKNVTRQQRIAWKIGYFIFLFRGIPISDAAMLTKKDIANNQIHFGRIKTKSKVPSIPIDNPKRKWILELLAPETDGNHLIPILFDGRHDKEQSKRNRINKVKTWVNTGLKEIAKKQGIQINMTTYVFRHTFSRKVLEKYGIWHLKEILGHKSVTTTQAYATSLSSKQLEVTDSVFE